MLWPNLLKLGVNFFNSGFGGGAFWDKKVKVSGRKKVESGSVIAAQFIPAGAGNGSRLAFNCKITLVHPCGYREF